MSLPAPAVEHVLAAEADQIVVAVAAAQAVGAGIALDGVVELVAGQVDRGRSRSPSIAASSSIETRRREHVAVARISDVGALAVDLDDRVAGFDEIAVVAGAAGQHVGAGLAVEIVLAGAADELVVAVAAIEIVEPVISVHQVVVVEAVQAIVGAEAVDDVRASRAVQVVVERGSVDRDAGDVDGRDGGDDRVGGGAVVDGEGDGRSRIDGLLVLVE